MFQKSKKVVEINVVNGFRWFPHSLIFLFLFHVKDKIKKY